MPEITFDRYWRYEEITRILREFAEAYPGLIKLESLGQSYEGRDIWLATVTQPGTGPAEEKPAFWVDGNIHATEVSACSAAIYLIHPSEHYRRGDLPYLQWGFAASLRHPE